MDLSNRIAVVTGASRGLGRHICQSLVEAGARVFGMARSFEDLRSVRDDLGEPFVPVACDVTDLAQVHTAFERVRKEAGRCDVLVNNAGVARFAGIDDQSPEDWHLQVDTNLSGVFACTRAAVPLMKAQNDADGFVSHIVNIASIAGLVGTPSLSAYNATKFGVRGFSDAVMKELRPHGIKVSCLYPGSIDTGFADEAGTSGNPNAMAPESVAETVLHVLGTPDGTLLSEVVMRPMKTAP